MVYNFKLVFNSIAFVAISLKRLTAYLVAVARCTYSNYTLFSELQLEVGYLIYDLETKTPSSLLLYVYSHT